MTKRIAVLDLNDGVPNLGLGSIVDLVESVQPIGNGDVRRPTSDIQPFSVELYDVRQKREIPGIDHDVYISTGGPGSPYDGEGSAWEADYFTWLDRLHAHNLRAGANGSSKKHALFICHSFELMVRHFGLAKVTKRRSPAFGIFPVHPTEAGKEDPVIGAADDPFYAADFRNWQVVEGDYPRFAELDATLLAREKVRSHVPLDRAIMSIRVGETILGVQFHPEASPEGMGLHFMQPEKRKQVIDTYGDDAYWKVIDLLQQPETLERTYTTIIPNFLRETLDTQ